MRNRRILKQRTGRKTVNKKTTHKLVEEKTESEENVVGITDGGCKWITEKKTGKNNELRTGEQD